MQTICIHLVKISNYFFLLCPSTSKTNPIALIKTNSEVEPAEINGSGRPVGGIEPLNISYCIINFCTNFLKSYMFKCLSLSQNFSFLFIK